MKKLLENLLSINEHKTEVLFTVDEIVDDDSGIYANDDFDFGILPRLEELCKDPQLKEKLVKFVRDMADMIERDY